MTDDLTALGQGLLGPDVTIVAGRIPDLQDPLWPQELALIPQAGPARTADFTAGRFAIRRGLTLLGLAPQPILRGPGGKPIWPDGIIGSVTHSGGLCLAAVGRTGQWQSIGVDLEPLSVLEPALVNEICTAGERDWIAAQPDAPELPVRIFTAKEATYKALYPLTGVVFDFAALTINLTTHRDGFTATLTRDIGSFPAGTTLNGRQGIAGNICLSTLKIPLTQL